MRKHYRAYNRSPFSLLMFAAVLVLAAAVLFLVRRQGALSGSVDALMAENRRLQEQESAMEAEIDALRRKKKLGRLSVEGTELLGPDGTPVRLKGISSHGLAWYPEYRDWMRVCAYKGVNPQSILQNYVGQRADGTKIEMWDEINVQQDVANIYILLGANALLQQTDDGFLKFYGELLDKLRVRFPDTPIYVQSITPTTQEYGEKKPQLEREHLKLINNAIAKLAVSKGLYYVDLWEVMADENGYLRADLAGSDGLHLLDGSKYRPWLDYLAAHTIYSAHNAQFALADGGAYR